MQCQVVSTLEHHTDNIWVLACTNEYVVSGGKDKTLCVFHTFLLFLVMEIYGR